MTGNKQDYGLPDTPEARVELAYGLIRSAATMLSAFPYEIAAAELRRQEDLLPLTDPTGARELDRDDFARKLRLLDAAADFLKEWNAVKQEALGNDG